MRENERDHSMAVERKIVQIKDKFCLERRSTTRLDFLLKPTMHFNCIHDSSRRKISPSNDKISQI